MEASLDYMAAISQRNNNLTQHYAQGNRDSKCETGTKERENNRDRRKREKTESVVKGRWARYNVHK